MIVTALAILLADPASVALYPVADARRASSTSRRVRSRAASVGEGGGAATYRNCAQARAAGAAPLRRGQPGYSTKLDRDRDGVACE